jgi:hypothetical protein
MRTKGPLILVSIFLIAFGLFICWGGSILLRGASVGAVFFFAIGLGSMWAGCYFLRRVFLHFVSANKLPSSVMEQFHETITLSEGDEFMLKAQFVKVNKWMKRNIIFGILFLLIAFTVPSGFLGLHAMMNFSASGGGYDTLAQRTSGEVLITVVGIIEGFLIWFFIREREKLQTDLEKRTKVRLAGVVKGIDKERFAVTGNLVIGVGDMELDSLEVSTGTRFTKGTKVNVEVAIHSLVILSVTESR